MRKKRFSVCGFHCIREEEQDIVLAQTECECVKILTPLAAKPPAFSSPALLPHRDLEVALTPEPSSLPTLLPPRPWSHRTGAADWEETGAAEAWDSGSLGGDGATAWRLRRHQSPSPRPLCSLLAHGRVARGASRSLSPAVHASSSRLSSPSTPSSPLTSTCRSSVPRVGRRRASGECVMEREYANFRSGGGRPR